MFLVFSSKTGTVYLSDHPQNTKSAKAYEGNVIRTYTFGNLVYHQSGYYLKKIRPLFKGLCGACLISLVGAGLIMLEQQQRVLISCLLQKPGWYIQESIC